MPVLQAAGRGYHRNMGRLRYLVFFLALSAFAANVKLYMKDGEFHLVREYKVEAGRVRYSSVERGDWEEVPTALVDLKRTEDETKARQAAIAEEAKLITAEDKAERERANEVSKVPAGPGVHLVVAGGIHTPEPPQSEHATRKGRHGL